MTSLCRGVTLLLMATGCAGSVEHSTEASTSDDDVRVEKHLNGLRYIPLRENHPEAFSAERAAARYSGAGRKDAAAKRDIAELSDRELIEHMSGLTLIDNWIYRVEPELETARAARSAPRSHVGRQPERIAAAEAVGVLSAPLSLPAANERRLQTNTTDYPYSAIVYLSDLNPPAGASAAGGTGVMIGRYTLLSAAHNFYDGANFRWFEAQPGADIAAADKTPFGGTQCYGVVVAASDNISIEDDYAVVDFHFEDDNGRCTDSPGDQTGWMGVPSYSDSELDGMTVSVFGYPVNVNPYPRLWGGSGTVTVLGDQLLWLVDTSQGQSGGPVYVTTADGWADVVGVVSRHEVDRSPREHFGPQIDNDVNLNINAWSSEY